MCNEGRHEERKRRSNPLLCHRVPFFVAQRRGVKRRGEVRPTEASICATKVDTRSVATKESSSLRQVGRKLNRLAFHFSMQKAGIYRSRRDFTIKKSQTALGFILFCFFGVLCQPIFYVVTCIKLFSDIIDIIKRNSPRIASIKCG